MVSAIVQALAYHCEECRRSFLFALTVDNPVHWSKPLGSSPTYCPCCGSYHAVADGEFAKKQANCPLGAN